MQQAVDAAEIDERPVLGEVLHHAGDHRAFVKMFQRGALADGDLFLDRRFARDHHIAAAAVQLDDLDRNVLPDQRIEIVHGARIGLRTGHEGLDAYIHREAAFHAAQHAAGDHQLLLVRLFEIVPDAQARGARVREQHVPFGLLAGVIDHHVDGIAGLHRHFAGRGPETARWEPDLRICIRNR